MSELRQRICVALRPPKFVCSLLVLPIQYAHIRTHKIIAVWRAVPSVCATKLRQWAVEHALLVMIGMSVRLGRFHKNQGPYDTARYGSNS